MQTQYPSEKVYYHKLVRDRVPDVMRERGATFVVETLADDAVYAVQLANKLVEEAREVAAADARESIVSELGDLLDVVDELRRLHRIGDDELAQSRARQFARKGGFAKRLLLVWSQNP